MLRKLTSGSVARAATASIARPRYANATASRARSLSSFDATGSNNADIDASRGLRVGSLPRRWKTADMAGGWTASRAMSSASSQEEEVRAQLLYCCTINSTLLSIAASWFRCPWSSLAGAE